MNGSLFAGIIYTTELVNLNVNSSGAHLVTCTSYVHVEWAYCQIEYQWKAVESVDRCFLKIGLQESQI